MPAGRHRNQAEGKIDRAVQDGQDGGEAGEDNHRPGEGTFPAEAKLGKLFFLFRSNFRMSKLISVCQSPEMKPQEHPVKKVDFSLLGSTFYALDLAQLSTYLLKYRAQVLWLQIIIFIFHFSRNNMIDFPIFYY